MNMDSLPGLVRRYSGRDLSDDESNPYTAARNVCAMSRGKPSTLVFADDDDDDRQCGKSAQSAERVSSSPKLPPEDLDTYFPGSQGIDDTAVPFEAGTTSSAWPSDSNDKLSFQYLEPLRSKVNRWYAASTMYVPSGAQKAAEGAVKGVVTGAVCTARSAAGMLPGPLGTGAQFLVDKTVGTVFGPEMMVRAQFGL